MGNTNLLKGVTMAYFTSRDITAIALFAALWSVLSAYVAPIFWNATHMPFLCDILGVTSLILVLWYVRKFGAVTFTGVIATIIILALRPNAAYFLGFTTASVIFDVLTRIIGYKNCLEKPVLCIASLLSVSTISMAVAGAIIGTVFTNPNFLTKMFGGVAFFTVLHAIGGIIGGILGIMLMKALSTRISVFTVRT